MVTEGENQLQERLLSPDAQKKLKYYYNLYWSTNMNIKHYIALPDLFPWLMPVQVSWLW
jgi:hypothetical protein